MIAVCTDPQYAASSVGFAGIKWFHKQVLREGQCGLFHVKGIADVDQTPFPLVLDDGRTYDAQGSKKFGQPVPSRD